MEAKQSLDLLDFDFDAVPSGTFDGMMDFMPIEPIDGSLQMLQMQPGSPLAATTPALTAGVTGLFQQHQDAQRPHSFAGWLTNNELVFPMPLNRESSSHHYASRVSSNASSPMTPSSFVMKSVPQMDMPFHTLSPGDKPRAALQPHPLSVRCSSLDSSNQRSCSTYAAPKHLAGSVSKATGVDAGVPDLPSMLEGLSKEGLKALREARNREKNKRAQKLFRERSKLRAKENETRVKELLEELKASEEEIEQQAQRILLLESALALRQPVDIRMSSGRPSSGSPGGSSSVVGVVGAMPQVFTPFNGWEDFDPSNTLVLTARDGEPLMLTAQQVQQLTWDEFKDLWRDYVNKLAMCLLDADVDLNSPSGQRMKGLNNEAGALCACVALNNPKLMHTFMTTCLEEETALLEKPTLRRWLAIMKSIGLTEAQKKTLLRHRRYFFSTLEMLTAERKKTEADLAGISLSVDHLNTTTMAPEFLKLVTATERLNRIVEECHRCACRFMAMGWRDVLTPVQSANFIVQSYPWGPDVMSLGNAAAAEGREGPRGPRETNAAGPVAPMGLLPGSDEMHALLLQRQGLSGGRPL